MLCLAELCDWQGKKSKDKGGDSGGKEALTRIAIVSDDKCKPKRCKQECKKSCPVVRMGKLCIEADARMKTASLSEELCIGCGICVKKCPFEAIQIINLPKNLEKETTHRYGANTFKLHRRLAMTHPVPHCIALCEGAVAVLHPSATAPATPTI